MPRRADPGIGIGGSIHLPPGVSQGWVPGQYLLQQGYPSIPSYPFPSPQGFISPSTISYLPPHDPVIPPDVSHSPQHIPVIPPDVSHSPQHIPVIPPDISPNSSRVPIIPLDPLGPPRAPATPASTNQYPLHSTQPYQQPSPASAPALPTPRPQQFQHRKQSQRSTRLAPSVNDHATLAGSSGASSIVATPLKSVKPPKAFRSTPRLSIFSFGRDSLSKYSMLPTPLADDRTHYTQPNISEGSVKVPVPKRPKTVNIQSESQTRRMESSAAESVLPPVSLSTATVHTWPDGKIHTATNLSSRPSDWRAEYSPKRGISSYLPKIGKVRTNVKEHTDSIKRSMHPLLLHTLEHPPLAFDLRYDIMGGANILLQAFGMNYKEVSLGQPAANPTARALRLYHPNFPWYIDIYQSHPNGVTVFDVLVQLSRQMQTPIHIRHYFNEALDAADRAALKTSFKERTEGRRGEHDRGVLRVEFLGEKCVLEGLVRNVGDETQAVIIGLWFLRKAV